MSDHVLTGTEVAPSRDSRPPRPSRARALRLAGIGLASILASGAVGWGVAGWQCARRAAAWANAPWHGKLDRTVQAGNRSPGVQVGGAASAVGAEIAPGSTVSTDGWTRARIAFDDGSSAVLDRNTEVVLGDGPRSLRVTKGGLLADVSEGAQASFVTDRGEAKTSGGKMVITALGDALDVEVLRGAARVGVAGKWATVESGQEALASQARGIDVAPANDLGQRVAFGEGFAGEHDEDTDAPVSGLGELRAKKPGTQDERDRAVRLARHDVKVRIVGDVARTEIDETFANDTDDVLEGIYRFPLPPGAQIERLALEVDGKLEEGEFVDKQRAAAIFRGAIQNATPFAPRPKEEIIWVPGPWRDPALLEWKRGGRAELRIFPIPKKGQRRIVLAYTETIAPVAGVRRYVYPLPQGSASDLVIDDASFDVQVLGAEPSFGVKTRGYELAKDERVEENVARRTAQLQRFTPSGDLVVEYETNDHRADATAWAYTDARSKSGDAFVAIALRPKLPGWGETRGRDQVIVVDSGRAMFGERLQRAKRLAVQITQEMDRRDRVRVIACDVTCRAMSQWVTPGSAAAHDVDAFLANEDADGASDLVGDVRAASHLDGRDPSRDLRVVLLTDGAASAGYRARDRVAGEVADALPDGRAMIVAVPIGADADTDTLGEIARGGGGVLVPYQPGEKLETAALDVLGASYGVALRDVELTLPDGLREAAPAQLPPLRAGSETIVTARLDGAHASGDVVLRGKVAGEPFEARYPIDVTATSDEGNAFVPRLYAAARIADDERRTGADARKEAVDLSRRYAVPSRFTSLLVLESEAMYSAFGIQRADRGTTWTGETAARGSEVAKVDATADDKNKDELGLDPDETEHAARADSKGYKESGGEGLGFGGAGGAFATGEGNAGPATAAPAPMPTMTAPPPSQPSTRGFPVETTPVPSASSAPFAHDPLRDRPADVDRARPQRLPPPPPRRWTPPPVSRGRWMKREWFRTSVIKDDDRPAVAADKIATAEAALAAAPDARQKHVELVRLLERNGALDELDQRIATWSTRDPLDADAIAARADLLEEKGSRERALRVLGGVAAASPEDANALGAVAAAHERAGKRDEACAFRVARAELREDDADAVGAAVACERAQGHDSSVARWLARAKDDAMRARIGAAAAKTRGADNVAFGDVVVDATWDGGEDVDLAVVDPSGRRLAWDGRATNLRAADCTSGAHEALAISSTSAGTFVVEIVRASAETQDRPVRGKLRVTSVGFGTRVIPFVLTGTRTQVARVEVRWDSRLVPASDADIPRATR